MDQSWLECAPDPSAVRREIDGVGFPEEELVSDPFLWKDDDFVEVPSSPYVVSLCESCAQRCGAQPQLPWRCSLARCNHCGIESVIAPYKVKGGRSGLRIID